MENIDYVSGIIWLCSWPVLIWIAYKFVSINIEHFEKYLSK